MEERFVYNGWNLVAILNGSDVLQKHYTWGLDISGSEQGAGGVGGLLAVYDTSSSYFAYYDGNGNITAYSDGSNNSVATYFYSPFGAITEKSGLKKDDFNFKFSTKFFDNLANLYYYGFRYYSPRFARWINRDPIGEQGGINLYAMVGNNAVNKWDKLGFGPGDCCIHCGGDHDEMDCPDINGTRVPGDSGETGWFDTKKPNPEVPKTRLEGNSNQASLYGTGVDPSALIAKKLFKKIKHCKPGQYKSEKEKRLCVCNNDVVRPNGKAKVIYRCQEVSRKIKTKWHGGKYVEIIYDWVRSSESRTICPRGWEPYTLNKAKRDILRAFGINEF